MPPPEVIALADEVHAHRERGDVAVLGPIDLGPAPATTSARWAREEPVAILVGLDSSGA